MSFSFSSLFHCFFPYSRSNSFFISFSTFFSFHDILLVLQCVFLIFHVFQFSCYTPGHTVCICLLPHVLMFLTTFPIKQCWYLIFHVFQFSRHNPGVSISFFTLFKVSRHISHPTVCFSFSMIFSFFTIFQVLQCAFLIFHFFKCFSPYSRSYRFCVSFSTFFGFLAIILVL